MGSISRLDAVNDMLMAAGETPVNSLSDDGINDVAIAEKMLDTAARRVQGYSFNASTVKYTATPDSSGHISLASNVVDVDTTGRSSSINVSQRGEPAKLWNLDDQTYVFTDPVELEVVEGLTFDDLPALTQEYAVARAARRYQMQTQGDRDVDAQLREDELEARGLAMAADVRARDANILDSWPGAAQIGRRRFSFSRTRR